MPYNKDNKDCRGNIMKIEHLKYVIETVRCGSISRAANSLFFSQSNLSNIIKNIESEMGYSIFERTKDGISPTKEGKIFIQCAENIITEYKKMQSIPVQLGNPLDTSILCSRSPFVIRCFFQFCNRGKKGEYRDTFQEVGIKTNLESVIARRGRIGIIAILSQRLEKYQKIALNYDLTLTIIRNNIPLAVIMNKQHQLCSSSSVNISDISRYPFVADLDVDYDDTLEIFDITDLRKVLYVTDRASMYEAVYRENYISTILGIDILDAEEHRCIGRPIENFETSMVLFYIKRNDTVLNQREKAYLEFLRSQLDSYIR